jgi:hypothetical protein
MTEMLTTNLRLELEKTNAAFNRWAEKSVDHINASDAVFKVFASGVERSCFLLAV